MVRRLLVRSASLLQLSKTWSREKLPGFCRGGTPCTTPSAAPRRLAPAPARRRVRLANGCSPRFVLGTLERVGSQALQFRETQRHRRILPHGEPVGPLLHEDDLPSVVAETAEAAVVGPVEELPSRADRLPCQQGSQVVPIEVDLESLARGVLALGQLLLDLGLASRQVGT